MHIVKRDSIPVWKAWLIRGAAILAALVICAILLKLVTDMNPADVFKKMIDELFGTERKTWNTFYEVVLLLGVSLAVTPAFKMRFWNIGAEGQALIGAFAAYAVLFYASKLPIMNDPSVSLQTKNLIVIPWMLAAAIAAGALWGFLPAFFKSRWNTNETLFTLMMNYVATYLLQFMLDYPNTNWRDPGGSATRLLNPLSRKGNPLSEVGWFPRVRDTRNMIAIIVIAAITVLLFLYLRYSKHGYEISVVGESERTASYAGIKVNRVIIRTMILSGALCGLIGFLIIGGSPQVATNTIDGRGYTAVMVSWMSKFNPIGMVFSSMLLVFVQYGATKVPMPDGVSLNKDFANILMAIILFFLIGCEFFINYKLQLGRHKKRGV